VGSVQLLESGLVARCGTTRERPLAIAIIGDKLEPGCHLPN
jgi:hypothetical protein